MRPLGSKTLVGWLSVGALAFASLAHASETSSAAHVLQAASGSSPRPSECRTSGVDRAHTFWDRARDPRLGKYCDLLAKGYARLEGDPAEALAAATRATALEPTRSAPRLLLARALVLQGRMPEAFQAFQQALQQPGSPELSPAGLHAYAMAAVGSGEVERGLAAYRRLVPMASLLTAAGASERVYVETAVLVMQREPLQLQESVAYLNEARRQNASLALRPFVLSALALALDRQGRHEEARGVAREAHGHAGLLLGQSEAMPSGGTLGVATPGSGTLRVPLPRVDPVELLAMTAMLTAIDDPELAKQYWRDFIERAPPSHPWLAHARGKLALRG